MSSSISSSIEASSDTEPTPSLARASSSSNPEPAFHATRSSTRMAAITNSRQLAASVRDIQSSTRVPLPPTSTSTSRAANASSRSTSSSLPINSQATDLTASLPAANAEINPFDAPLRLQPSLIVEAEPAPNLPNFLPSIESSHPTIAQPQQSTTSSLSDLAATNAILMAQRDAVTQLQEQTSIKLREAQLREAATTAHLPDRPSRLLPTSTSKTHLLPFSFCPSPLSRLIQIVILTLR